MSNLGAMSESGHNTFLKFIQTYDRKPDWDEVKSSISPAMLKFLKGSAAQNG